MMYVDESLCTGCGICVDACTQGAISSDACRASIDPVLCTSCGCCIDACRTDAIVSVETISEYPIATLSVPRSENQPLRTRTSPLSPDAVGAVAPSTASPAPRYPATSKLDVAEKVLSGLVTIAALVLERGQGRSVAGTASRSMPGGGAVSWGAGGACRSGRRRRGGGGRGLGSGRGRAGNPDRGNRTK
jgi:NAD-dependent dihydropyrimidine dehydrogenase PreA subunit